MRTSKPEKKKRTLGSLLSFLTEDIDASGVKKAPWKRRTRKWRWKGNAAYNRRTARRRVLNCMAKESRRINFAKARAR